MTRRSGIRRFAGALAVLAVVVAAAGCVEDLSGRVGGAATVLAVNDNGSLLVQSTAGVARIDPDGSRTAFTAPAGATSGSPMMLGTDGIAAGVASAFANGPSGPLTTFPVVWNPDGSPIDLRPALEGGDRIGLNAWPFAFSDHGVLFGYLSYNPGGTGSAPVRRAFAWDVRTRRTHYLPAALDDAWGGDVNDGGVIVATNASGSYRLIPAADGSYPTAESLPLRASVINNGGDIAGIADATHVAVLRAGSATPLTLAPFTLPRDPTLPEFGPRALLNDKGTVVVTDRDPMVAPTGHPQRYASYDAQPEAFPGLNASTDEWVTGLNNVGDAVGVAQGPNGQLPFRWS